MKRALLFVMMVGACWTSLGGERDAQVNGDKAALAGDERWTYNDLDAGFAKARESGKPLLVVFRCVP